MIDLLALGVLQLRTRPLRAFLAGLAIAVGAATMLLVTAIPAAGQGALERQLAALGTNLLRAEPAQQTVTPVSLPEEAVAWAGRIPPVTHAAAVGNTHAPIGRSDLVPTGDATGVAVLAGTGDLLGALGGTVYSGAFLGPATDALPTVVLGSVAATRLGITSARGGPQVWIGRRWFTVIGVLAPLPLAPDLDRAALVGWPAAKAELGFDGHPTVVYVRARDDAVEDVRAVLPRTLSPPTYGNGVLVGRPSDALAAQRLTRDAFDTLLLALTGVALAVGGVGVANTMALSVLERRREIGLRRALGASRAHIRAQFLVEAVVLCGAGGLAGAAAGALAAAAYSAWRGWPVAIPAGVAALAPALAAAVGALAGAYPAVRAARLSPTEALAAP
ncbi:ABC transporter permease [Dactylosporangium sp. CA-092794]|uniref:ABC transporter permease n=1 Tax=Dactylosporangium sp. CA-092794 TaxID=3239929 RepID=UPI003D92F91B